MYINGYVSHWMENSNKPNFEKLGATGESNTNASTRGGRMGLPKETQDLVIVGAGLTGLWTAYYALKAHPSWKITVLESHEVGYGASGRNGGWLSTLIPGNRAVYAKSVNKQGRDGMSSVHSFQREVIYAIEEVLRVLKDEGIEANAIQGGNLSVAQTTAGFQRIKSAYEADLRYGYMPEDVRLLTGEEAQECINIDGAKGALFYEHTTALDPALLTRGLAQILLARGVRICEQTRASYLGQGSVETERGTVYGTHVLSCLEAYTGDLKSDAPFLGSRKVIPVNSSMILTQELSDSEWEGLGWNNGECLNDAAHTFVYAQRTQDNRIAIGGRGNPYAYNSGTPGEGAVDKKTVEQLHERLQLLFPRVTFDVEHAWRGSIGVTRDWCAQIHYDPHTGVGAAFGYAGHGVTATNLAARTLIDRIHGESSVLTRLPWNDHDSGLWEPEPLRWVGVHAMYRLFGIADQIEEARDLKDTSIIARIGARIAGRNE